MTPVTIKQLRFGYFPKVFVVNGIEYAVQEVVKCWTDVENARLWFSVSCRNGATFDLYRNAANNTWAAVN